MIFFACLSIPFFVLLFMIAFLPHWAPERWNASFRRYIGVLVVTTIGATVALFPHFFGHFFHTFWAEYLPFVLCLGCLYVLSCGVHVEVRASPTPMWNALCLFFGAITSAIFGTVGSCVIWTNTLLNLNKSRVHKTHTFIFLIFIVANVGGMFSSLGDPPLLLGFLKGLPFFWPTQHLSHAGGYILGILLLAYYGIEHFYYRKETRDLSWKNTFSHVSPISIRGWGYILGIVGFTLGMVFIQKTVSGVWTMYGIALSRQDVYKLAWLLGGLLVALTRKKYLPKVSSHMLGELGWIFLGLFLCVVPVMHLLQALRAYPFFEQYLSSSPKWLFWISGGLSSFLDNAPTYVLFVELAGGFSHIPLQTLKHIACGTVAMGAMTYIGNAPNLLVKGIVEHHKESMPSFFGYMKWSVCIMLVLVFTLVHGTKFLQ